MIDTQRRNPATEPPPVGVRVLMLAKRAEQWHCAVYDGDTVYLPGVLSGPRPLSGFAAWMPLPPVPSSS